MPHHVASDPTKNPKSCCANRTRITHWWGEQGGRRDEAKAVTAGWSWQPDLPRHPVWACLLVTTQFRQRRRGGKETPMKLSLRDMLTRLTGRAAPRRSPRPRRTTSLRVESLEDRTVPTAFINSYSFNMGSQGTLYVNAENMQTGQFSGSFNEAGVGWINVTGSVTEKGGGLSSIYFSGSTGGRASTSYQSVSFQGTVTDSPNWMSGKLTETSSFMSGLHRTTSSTTYSEMAHANPILR
jgi:hypothetical protein